MGGVGPNRKYVSKQTSHLNAAITYGIFIIPMKRPKRSRLLMVISLSSAVGMLLHSMLTLADEHLRERYRLRQQDFELALRIISEPTKFDDPARAWASGVVEEYTSHRP